MSTVNFPNSPSNGQTLTTNTGITYTYNSAKSRWDATTGYVTASALDNYVQVANTASFATTGQLDNYLQVANSSSGVTAYSDISDLPLSGQETGKLAYVTGSNRLYLWAGSGWYNIALINTDPSISGASASYTLSKTGANTVVTLASTDPEGIPITFSLSTSGLGVGANAIATVTQSNNIFTFTPTTNTSLAGTFTATFTASDGVNLAVANSSFTLAFSVTNSNYTTALVTSVGVNLADNNDFVDSSTNSHTITAAGNVTQSTFSPYRHGGYSTYFDGSGDYLTIADDASLDFGTGDFTVECWFNLPTNSSNNPIIFGSGWYFQTKTSDSILSFYTGSTEYTYSIGSSLATNTWHHIAAARSGSTLKVFLNGVEVNSVGNTDNIQTTGSGVLIGRLSGQTSFDFKGYITDVRIVKGTAVYTSNFTPPTKRLTAITNTSLLACHLPYIADGSTNGHAITVTGDTLTQPFSPYDYGSYIVNENGGSNFFTTSNDYLTVPYSSTLDLGSNDFTIEWWMNPTTTAGDQVIFVQSNNLGLYGPLWIRYNGGVLKAWATTAGGTFNLFNSTTISGSIPVNSWTHVAITRNSSGVWKTYLNGVQSYTSTAAGSLYVNSNDTVIGGSAPANYDFEGSLADFRIVNGTVVYTSDFTPPTAPLTAITNTSLLISGTNAGIIDKSQSLKYLSLFGNASSSTTQAKYLSSSIKFDGTGDYIDIGLDADSGCDFGTGDFTIEGWFHIPSLSTYYIADARNPFPGDSWAVFISSSRLYFYDGATSRQTTNAPATGQWQHFAITRESGSWRMFLDGSLEAGPTSVTRSIVAGSRLRIGASGAATPGSPLNGYLSDFRITKGLARYTAAFTPPTAALEA